MENTRYRTMLVYSYMVDQLENNGHRVLSVDYYEGIVWKKKWAKNKGHILILAISIVRNKTDEELRKLVDYHINKVLNNN